MQEEAWSTGSHAHSHTHEVVQFRGGRGSESESAGSRTTNSSREGSRASKRELIRRQHDCVDVVKPVPGKPNTVLATIGEIREFRIVYKTIEKKAGPALNGNFDSAVHKVQGTGSPVPVCRDLVLGTKTRIFIKTSQKCLFSFQTVLRDFIFSLS